MGGIKRKRKNYSKPKKPFDKERILIENELVKKYGLKNKKEIYKAKAKISRLRKIAKKLITESEEKQKKFIEKIKSKGYGVNNIQDVLSLEEKDYLERRLQTFVYKKKIAKTIKEARQLIVHRKILVGDRIVNVPSYFVKKEEENEIKIK